MMAETKVGDVLMVPFLIKGHFTPMMYVAKNLLREGLSITMLMPIDQQKTLLGNSLEEEGMEGFNVQTVMSLRDVKDGDKGILGSSTNFGRACAPVLTQLLEQKESREQGPKCIIADQFLGWTQDWADKLHIPRYVSVPSPAVYAYLMYNHSSLIAKGILEHGDEDPVIELPGIPPVYLGDLSGAAKQSPRFLTDSGDTFGHAAGMLFNTFYELESSAIEAFHEQIKANNTREKVTRMLPIGPMLPPEFFSDSAFESTATDSECIQWLRSRRAGSVLYVAFGSVSYLSPPQIVELAHALEASGVSFLWVLRVRPSPREAVDISTLLPPDFQTRTKDQGLVYTEFAPQLEILSHPATGGFLTHCGWNSSLESICRGVPMIGWPMGAEQKLCCRILVDLAKVASYVKPNAEGSVDRSGIEKAVRQLMIEPTGRALKERVSKLKGEARAAMAPGGSSSSNFQILVKDVKRGGNKA